MRVCVLAGTTESDAFKESQKWGSVKRGGEVVVVSGGGRKKAKRYRERKRVS